MQVRILGSRRIPPTPQKITSLIEDMVSRYYEHYPQMSVLELADWTYFKFAYIHPFIDGDGRTIRLIMILILRQYCFLPTVILHLDRKKYYRV